MPIDLKLKGSPPLDDWAKPYEEMPSKLQLAITKALGSAGEEVKRAAVTESPRSGRKARGKPVWKGKLIASILTEVKGNTAKIGPNKSIAPYGKVIEFGGHPNNLQWSKVKLWAKDKGIEQYAGAIFRKLKKDGVQANPFLSRAFAKSKNRVSKRFEVALSRALEGK